MSERIFVISKNSLVYIEEMMKSFRITSYIELPTQCLVMGCRFSAKSYTFRHFLIRNRISFRVSDRKIFKLWVEGCEREKVSYIIDRCLYDGMKKSCCFPSYLFFLPRISVATGLFFLLYQYIMF